MNKKWLCISKTFLTFSLIWAFSSVPSGPLESQTDHNLLWNEHNIQKLTMTIRYNQKSSKCSKMMRTNNRKYKTCPLIKEFVHTFNGLLQDLKDMSENLETKYLSNGDISLHKMKMSIHKMKMSTYYINKSKTKDDNLHFAIFR